MQHKALGSFQRLMQLVQHEELALCLHYAGLSCAVPSQAVVVGPVDQDERNEDAHQQDPSHLDHRQDHDHPDASKSVEHELSHQCHAAAVNTDEGVLREECCPSTSWAGCGELKDSEVVTTLGKKELDVEGEVMAPHVDLTEDRKATREKSPKCPGKKPKFVWKEDCT